MTGRSTEEHVAELIRERAGGVRAPDRLRARIDADRARRAPRWRRGMVSATAAGGAVVLAVLVVLFTGGSGPTVQEVAAAALNPPTRPGPALDPRDPRRLAISVDGLAFPSWREPWGWEATGARTDSVAGREAVTVVYRNEDSGVHYTIVEGDPLPRPPGAETVREGGRRLSVLDGRRVDVVTWRQDGRTCVLASDNVPAHELVELAGWR